MKKINLAVGIAGLSTLGSLLAVPSTSVFADSTSNAATDNTIKDATFDSLVFLVNVRHKLGDKSNWYGKSVEVSNVIPLYNPDRSEQGYVIEFQSNGTSNGYAVVSVNPNSPGVIAYNDSGQPDLPALQNNQVYTFIPTIGLDVMTIEQNGDAETAQSGKIHGWQKVSKVNTQRQNDWKHAINLENASVGNSATLSSNLETNGVSSSDPQSWITDQSLVSKSLVNGVGIHDLLQSSFTWDGYESPGCSPTSGAMLMWFWADNGHSSLFPSHSSPTWQNKHDLIWALRSTMGTTQLSDGTGDTQPANVGPGLSSYAKAHGDSTVTIPYGYTWSGFESEIDNYKPVLLNFEQPYYGSHTTFAVGYENFFPKNGISASEGSQWIAQHDNLTTGIMWMDYSTTEWGTIAFQWVGFHP